MDELRSLPKVDALSRSKKLAGFPEQVRIDAARAAVDNMREAIRSGSANGQAAEDLAPREAERMTRSSLKPAINLSGVILHTGLGRAKLAQAAIDQVARVMAGHSTVEIDLECGKRGNRQDHVRGLLLELTGAEDALVV